MKELIVSEIKGDKVVKDGITLNVEPRCAYLVPNTDGTHERYVSDDNSVLSKQGKNSKDKETTSDNKADKNADNLTTQDVEKWKEKLNITPTVTGNNF